MGIRIRIEPLNYLRLFDGNRPRHGNHMMMGSSLVQLHPLPMGVYYPNQLKHRVSKIDNGLWVKLKSALNLVHNGWAVWSKHLFASK